MGATGRLAIPTSTVGTLNVGALSGPTGVVGLQYGHFRATSEEERGPVFLAGYYLIQGSTFAGLRLGLVDGGGTQVLFPAWPHRVGVGVEGERSAVPFELQGVRYSLAGGGIRGELVLWPRSVLHWSVGLRLGGGVLAGGLAPAGLLAATPDVELRVRLADFVQLGLLVGGRVAVPLWDGLGLTVLETSGFHAGARLRFGAF